MVDLLHSTLSFDPIMGQLLLASREPFDVLPYRGEVLCHRFERWHASGRSAECRFWSARLHYWRLRRSRRSPASGVGWQAYEG